MFRIGTLLYIPAYLSVILYRVFASASDDGNLVLMAGERSMRTFGCASTDHCLRRSFGPKHVSGKCNFVQYVYL